MANPAADIHHVVVLGLMGAGKTTIGRAFAQRLGWFFSDSDEQIQAQTGQAARVLKEALGAGALHELEAAHLLDALDDAKPTVIGAAASVVDLERCRSALRAPEVYTVWLNVPPARLAARFANDPHRPLYGADPHTFLQAQLNRRRAAFLELATLTVDPTDCTPCEVVDTIITASGLAHSMLGS